MSDISDKVESNFGRFMIGVVIVAALLLWGCRPAPTQYGTLEGKVSIGPLCPVERNPPDPNCLPTAGTYAGWPIYVYSKSNDVVGKLEPVPPKGMYSIRLPAGDYIVDLNNSRRRGSDNLPAEVKISADQTQLMNINIDTGIR